MGILQRIDRRPEPRTEIDLPRLIWGVDTEGERFVPEAHARDNSLSGALLSGVDADLRSGDVIGVRYGKKKARNRVVWIRCDAGGERMQVAVHRSLEDECSWQDLLASEAESVPDASPGDRVSVDPRLD